ncbi:MAG: S8 family serine peptidase [Lautropia sp.]|nr:S8 family serine peptidase [Lautropia sp.]
MSPATKHLHRWSLPLLVTLLAACGGSGGSSNQGNGNNLSGNQQGGVSGAPAVGEYLNAASCGVRYRMTAPAPQRTGTDPLLRQQWFLNNTGSLSGSTAGEDLNLIGTWPAGKGENVRIAIIDDAVDVIHNDLLPNIVAGASYNYRSYGAGNAYPVPCDTADNHGTQVAGVIAARDNNGIGVSGVAPRASLVGFNAIATGEDAHVADALVRDFDKNAIYNNSWGAQDDGHFYSAPGWMSAALESGLKHGRQGLGSIYVFAAGNGGCVQNARQECASTELSNYDGHVSQLGTLAVCAANAQGKRARYSEPGANLLVCAPSADLDPSLPKITTTEIRSAPGGTADQYTNGFNGTSAATPMVSGVVALMLQANPNLTWRDVRLVLAQTARKVDATNTGWTHFGGLNFNHEYGFGVADANAAVQLARTWQSVGGSDTLKQCGPYVSSAAATVIPEMARNAEEDTIDYNARATGGLSSAITIPSSCDIDRIEHVEITLSASATGTTSSSSNSRTEHPDAANLHITLTSPSNQTSTLVTPHACLTNNGNALTRTACQGLQSFTTGLTRHMEEPAGTASNRNWTLEAVDRGSGNSGQLNGWSITLYGR